MRFINNFVDHQASSGCLAYSAGTLNLFARHPPAPGTVEKCMNLLKCRPAVVVVPSSHTHTGTCQRPACFLFLISGKHAKLVVGFERVTPAPVQQGDCQAFLVIAAACVCR